MTMWSRRDVLRGAVGVGLLGLAGAVSVPARAGGRPGMTVYKDPT